MTKPYCLYKISAYKSFIKHSDNKNILSLNETKSPSPFLHRPRPHDAHKRFYYQRIFVSFEDFKEKLKRAFQKNIQQKPSIQLRILT